MAFNEEDTKLILEGTVDSRTKGSAGHPSLTHPLYLLERAYCVYCAKPGGYVSVDSSKYVRPFNVIYVCDACHIVHGELGLPRADAEVVAVEGK